MTLRKWAGTVNWKRKRYIALCEELALEEAMDLYDSLRNEWMNEWMNEAAYKFRALPSWTVPIVYEPPAWLI
jgi:hypothetical protein